MSTFLVKGFTNDVNTKMHTLYKKMLKYLRMRRNGQILVSTWELDNKWQIYGACSTEAFSNINLVRTGMNSGRSSVHYTEM